MDLLDLIREPKSKLDLGTWGTGHIPRTQFPIPGAKSKNYKFGSEYRWRIVRFDCSGYHCRILILLCESRQIFRATLATEVAGEFCIVCDHEFHNDEPGWHCHLTTKNIESVAPIATRRAHLRRWPGPNACSRQEFGVTEASALSLVAARFRFESQGELL